MKINKIYGPPGTGKTTTLLNITENLVTKYGEEFVAFLTFTRRAKRVAKERGLDLPYLLTVHSMAYRLGHVLKDEMVSPGKLQKWASEAGVTLPKSAGDRLIDGINDESPAALSLQAWEYIRNVDGSIWEFSHPAIGDEYLQQLVGSYEVWKHKNGFIDYTDLLIRSSKHGFLEPVRFRAVVIDEAQDLTPLQWKFVFHVLKAAGTEEVYLAGDDDQSIYAWAGASARYLNEIPGKTEVLKKSWRLPRQVWAAALRNISMIKDRQDKMFLPKDEEGKISFVGDLPDLGNDKDVLILARNTYLLKRVRKQLIDEGIPFFGACSPLDDEDRLRAYLALQNLKNGGQVSARSARLLLRRLPAKGARVDPQSLPDGHSYRAADLHPGILNLDIPMSDQHLTYLRRAAPQLADGQKIKLATVHQAKGDEAKHVVLITDISRKTALAAGREAGKDDERRVIYVALTRASEKLTIVYPRTDKSWMSLNLI